MRLAEFQKKIKTENHLTRIILAALPTQVVAKKRLHYGNQTYHQRQLFGSNRNLQARIGNQRSHFSE